jgi:hypothetical protein
MVTRPRHDSDVSVGARAAPKQRAERGGTPTAPHARMRAAIALALISAVAAPARAEPPYASPLADARRLQHSGAWVLGVGLAHLATALAVGVYDLAESAGCARARCTDYFPASVIVAGPLIGIGAVLTAVGGSLFGVGRARERRLRLTATGLAVQF